MQKRHPQKSKRSFYQKRKVCRFCGDTNLIITYRDFNTIRHFITERGKIIPRRISGTCAKHQRRLSQAIKRARVLSIVPFTVSSV